MQQALIKHTKTLGLTIDPNKAILLLQYLDILTEWNKVHNLCATASLEHMLGYHILDSLSIPAMISCNHQQLLDVGTGAGLPGIPIAIIAPDAIVTLLEPKAKKIVFLTHVINKLKLKNVSLAHAKIEDYMEFKRFDLIVSRGFCELKKLVALSHKLLKSTGSKIIAMKSDPREFMVGTKIFNDSTNQYIIENIMAVNIPLVTAKRTLISVGYGI